MPNTNPVSDPTLHLRCPRCNHDEAKLSVHSYTILTVICAKCSFAWSLEIAMIPEALRRQVGFPVR